MVDALAASRQPRGMNKPIFSLLVASLCLGSVAFVACGDDSDTTPAPADGSGSAGTSAAGTTGSAGTTSAAGTSAAGTSAAGTSAAGTSGSAGTSAAGTSGVGGTSSAGAAGTSSAGTAGAAGAGAAGAGATAGAAGAGASDGSAGAAGAGAAGAGGAPDVNSIDLNGCTLANALDKTGMAALAINTTMAFSYGPNCVKVSSMTTVTFETSTFHPLDGYDDELFTPNPISTAVDAAAAGATTVQVKFTDADVGKGYQFYCEKHKDSNNMTGVVFVVQLAKSKVRCHLV